MMELSVIVPCHNEVETLGEQLDALARESWTGEWEVIVVDNLSDDDTASLASSHAGLAARLRVVSAHQGKGVAYARRCGVERSNARSVVFCDGDDVIAPGWLAAIGQALREHPLVTGEIEVKSLNSPALATSRGRNRLGEAPTFAGLTFLRGNNGGMQRVVWDQLDGFDEDFDGLEDIEFSLRAAAAGLTVEFEPRALVRYRYRTGTLALWRQGMFYGGSYPRLVRRCIELGLVPPPRLAGWRSWAWVVAHAPRTYRRDVRMRWVWTFANRIGVLRGAVRTRTPMI